MRSMWNFPLFLCAKFLQLTLCRNCTHSEARIGIWNSGREFLTLQFLSLSFFFRREKMSTLTSSEVKVLVVEVFSANEQHWGFRWGGKSFRIFHIVFQRTATTSEREREMCCEVFGDKVEITINFIFSFTCHSPAHSSPSSSLEMNQTTGFRLCFVVTAAVAAAAVQCAQNFNVHWREIWIHFVLVFLSHFERSRASRASS